MNDQIDLDWLFARCSPEPNSGCWLWTKGLKGAGYAQIGYRDRRSVSAHIVAYELKYGIVPEGLELDHKCRVRCCINPDHTEPVTHLENMLRGDAGQKAAAANLAKTHCKRGHAYSGSNLYVNPSGVRVCRACVALSMRKHRSSAYV